MLGRVPAKLVVREVTIGVVENEQTARFELRAALSFGIISFMQVARIFPSTSAKSSEPSAIARAALAYGCWTGSSLSWHSQGMYW